MKVLMVTQPGLGHLHPMIPVAQALQQARHQIIFACAEAFRPRVESMGFTTLAAGLDWLESEAEKTFPELLEMPPEEQPRDWFLTEIFTDVAALQMVPDLLQICQEWSPDLIIRNDFEFASCIVGEKLDIPYATISVELFLSASAWDRMVGDQLAYLRSTYGLSPYPTTDMLYRYLHLSFMPPSFESLAFAAEPVTHSLRPVLHDKAGDERLPDWVEQLPSQPTIYVTLGTVFNQAVDIFQTIIEGLRDEPVNLIITIGNNQNPKSLGDVPNNVYVERYIPLSLLLPHCDLAITHGGYQTVLSVLSHGLPTLTIPVTATDPLRAIRCVETGMGLAVRSAPLDANFDDNGWITKQSSLSSWPALSPQSVRDTVQKLLHEPQYRQNAQRLCAEMTSLPVLEEAIPLLTKLAQEKKPQMSRQKTMPRPVSGTLASPQQMMQSSVAVTKRPNTIAQEHDPRQLYLDVMKRCLLGLIYEDIPLVRYTSFVIEDAQVAPQSFDREVRVNGKDLPSQAHTMIGLKRMDNIQYCVEKCLAEDIPGDLMETGVWRGGATIFMRAILKAFDVTDRTVWVADSFQGLPPANVEQYPADADVDYPMFSEILGIPLEVVQDNFDRYGLLDEQVRFLKGWFKDTLPEAPVERLAVLRLDGDMYESTMDTLTSLYAKLSVGGYLIIDDYNLPACKEAVHDYRREKGITETIIKIDEFGAYWRKE